MVVPVDETISYFSNQVIASVYIPGNYCNIREVYYTDASNFPCYDYRLRWIS